MSVQSLVVLISSCVHIFSNICIYISYINIDLQVSNHLVSLPDIVCLQPHPRQPASLHEVDQHVADGLEVVPPALFYALA